MKRLIRHKATQAFLTKGGGWSRRFHLAQEFLNARAVACARGTYQLRNCELYHLTGETPSPAEDFVIPIPDFHCPLSPRPGLRQ